MNASWLKEEYFTSLVKQHWKAFDPLEKSSATRQFETNIKHIKSLLKEWAHKKRLNEDQEPLDVETPIQLE